MDGILLVDKPAGLTSYDVVARAKRACAEKKIGHAGTLDPQATGLLVLALGTATRWLPYLLPDKRYQATLKLGQRTDTQDVWGRTLEEKDAGQLDPAEIRRVLESLAGEQDQVPPAVSALKHEGRPLYEWARQGREIEKPARRVTVYSLKVTRVEGAEADFEVHCSGGTYVRTLCAEAGTRLGVGGCLKALRRTTVGGFQIKDALSLEALEKGAAPALLDHSRALAHLRSLDLTALETMDVEHGRDLKRPAESPGQQAGPCRLLAADGGLLALGTAVLEGRDWVVHPERVFTAAKARV